MIIYFAGSGSRERNRVMIEKRCDRLFSYFVVVDKNSGYGEGDRFEELLKHENLLSGVRRTRNNKGR